MQLPRIHKNEQITGIIMPLKTKTIAKQTTINSNIAIIVFLLYFIDITYLYLIDVFYYTTINGRKKEMVTHFLFSNFFDSSSFTR